MSMRELYQPSLLGLWVILMTVVVQWFIAVRASRKQKDLIPGKIDPSLGHESFVFRSDRAFRNSLENLGPFLGLSLLAMITHYDARVLAAVVWVYAVARILHCVLYYKIATNKNPSPRSVFFAVGFFDMLFLAFTLGWHIIS